MLVRISPNAMGHLTMMPVNERMHRNMLDAERRCGQVSANIPFTHGKTLDALRKVGRRYKHIPIPLREGV